MNSKSETVAAAKREMAKETSKKLDENRAITGDGAAMRLCEELIQAAYDADIYSPYDLAQRVRKIKDAIGQSPHGNAFALREALIKIRNEIRSYCYDYGAGESHKSLVDRILDDPPDYTCYRDSILEIDGIVDAALAAPPRNCDRYPNAALALGAYHDGPPVGEEWDDADWMMFLDWLFATEKGGAE